ncbi:MAG: M23/M56 family metallopeptidase [Pseudomonadota bacterium]
MSLAVGVTTSIVWTGGIALFAEGLTRQGMTPGNSQIIWRLAALLMALPWAAAAFVWLVPNAVIDPGVNMPWADLLGAPHDFHASGTPSPRPGTSLVPPAQLETTLWIALLTGWSIRLMIFLRGHFKLAKITRSASLIEAGPLLNALRAAASKSGLARPPELAVIEPNCSPFVTGWLRPVLYVPRAMLGTSALAPIMQHECTHLARGDLFTRPLERGLADLIWFSPFAWLARARLDYWREAVCDDVTVRQTGDRLAYARALAFTARLCQPLPQLPATASLFNRKRTLPMRLTTLLYPVPIRSSRPRLIAGIAAALAAAPLALAQGLSVPGSVDGTTFPSAVIAHPQARITSSFGVRTHPITHKEIFHNGTDIGAPFGTPVLMPATGKVLMTGSKGNYGTIVEVQLEGSGHRLRFAQLQSFDVSVGDWVSAGEKIGEVGASGKATGPHLHIEYFTDDGDTFLDAETIDGLTLIAD